MNHNKNSISITLDRIWIKKKKEKTISYFSLFSIACNCIPFLSFLFFFLRKGDSKKKIKDYFVADNHFFNQWIGGYSESRSWESTS